MRLCDGVMCDLRSIPIPRQRMQHAGGERQGVRSPVGSDAELGRIHIIVYSYLMGPLPSWALGQRTCRSGLEPGLFPSRRAKVFLKNNSRSSIFQLRRKHLNVQKRITKQDTRRLSYSCDAAEYTLKGTFRFSKWHHEHVERVMIGSRKRGMSPQERNFHLVVNLLLDHPCIDDCKLAGGAEVTLG